MTAERTLIAGLGRDGLSLALALRAQDPRRAVTGYDSDPAAREEALRLHAVDLALESLDASNADLVLLALPAAEAPGAIATVASTLAAPAIVVDLAPVMLPSITAAARAQILPRFVPAHPVPSAPESPPDAARFRGASVLMGSPTDPDTPGARVAAMWTSLGAIPVAVAPAIHDALFALTHDLPILSAAALVRTLRRTGSLTRLLAPGSRALLDRTAHAASLGPSTETIAINAPKLVPALELLEREVRRLRQALAAGGPELEALLREAREFRQELAR